MTDRKRTTKAGSSPASSTVATDDAVSAAAGKSSTRRRGNGGTPPTGPRAPRASNAEVSDRVTVVLRLIVDGHTRKRQILRTLAVLHIEGKLNWGPRIAGDAYMRPDDAKFMSECISERTIELYIARATAELQAIADEQRHTAKGKARARYERALAGAVNDKAWDTVRKINRDLVRLDGLEPGAGVRHTVEGTINTTASGSVEVVHRAGGTIEERAETVNDLLGRAVMRRAQAVAAATAANN